MSRSKTKIQDENLRQNLRRNDGWNDDCDEED